MFGRKPATVISYNYDRVQDQEYFAIQSENIEEVLEIRNRIRTVTGNVPVRTVGFGKEIR